MFRLVKHREWSLVRFSIFGQITNQQKLSYHHKLQLQIRFILGLRAENFKGKKNAITYSNVAADESVTAITLSANFKSGGLTFIPEFRMDSGSANMFETGTEKSASQISMAVVYGF